MELWQIIVLAIVVTWFPAGYLGARIQNAQNLDKLLNFDLEGWISDFTWSRSAADDTEKKNFGFGVMFGWVTLFFFLYITTTYFALAVAIWTVILTFKLLWWILTKTIPPSYQFVKKCTKPADNIAKLFGRFSPK